MSYVRARGSGRRVGHEQDCVALQQSDISRQRWQSLLCKASPESAAPYLEGYHHCRQYIVFEARHKEYDVEQEQRVHEVPGKAQGAYNYHD